MCSDPPTTMIRLINTLIFFVQASFIVPSADYFTFCSLNLLNMAKRISKKTERYGDAVTTFSSNSDESLDDSFADKNFSPEKSPNTLNLLQFDSEFDKIECDISSQSRKARACETPVKSSAQQNSHVTFELKVMSQLQTLTNISKEILARYAVIEESLIKSGMMSSLKVANRMNEHDEFHFYIKSKNMPFKSVEAFKSFESSLDETSMQNGVS